MASTSYSSKQWDYDVFLSFRGEDTRKNFVGHLYRELSRAGINTFKDDETMKRGASISPQLISAIEGSMFAIIVFSKNYASSKWCLDELLKIMECKSEHGQAVIPFFYDIRPSEVRSQGANFAEAFSRYEEDFKGDAKKVQNWRKALTEAANLAGHDLHGSTYNGDESLCIEQIVKEIGNELCQKSTVSVTLVGAESQIRALSLLLMMGCEDVRFLGISGMGGIGKTTLASAIFHRFSRQFEGACYIANIKETHATMGLLYLQKTLLTRLLTIESVNLADEFGGIYMIRKKLASRKVLVVLDDVDHQDQLDGLAGAHDWFGKGSRIIITARDEHVLLDCDDTYKVPLLAIAGATQLFSWHAFRKTYPDNGFEQFSHKVVRYAGGLPLALKVLGSFLRRRNMQQWRSALDALRDIPSNEIISKLKISYDGLEDATKQVFLDLACLFGNGAAFYFREVFSEIEINVLVEKSLLFNSSGNIGMHDLIKEMGKQIAAQESPRRRIWLHKDFDILTENEGGEAIEGILIPFKSKEETIHLRAYAGYFGMIILHHHCQKILNHQFWRCLFCGKVIGLTFGRGQSICRLKYLKYLYLNRCTKLKNLPEDICDLVNLEELNASETSIWCIPNSITRMEKLKKLSFRKIPKLFLESDLCSWGCFTQIDLNFHLPSVLPASCMLTHLDLSACNLFVVPEDLGYLASLVQLNLSRNRFTYLPKSIALLLRLQLLDISYCEKLKELPDLPPGIMILFADDRFALQSIPTLSTMYKELYLVSFANQKLQEMWCNSRRESSSVQMRNCPEINMTNMLEDILLPFLSMVQQKLVFDDPRRGGTFSVVFPRCDPSVEVPSWFKYHTACSKEILLNLDKHWHNDKFLGFAIYFQLPFLNDGLETLSLQESFISSRILKINTKLLPEPASMNHQAVAKIVEFQVSDVVVCDRHDCFVFLQFDLDPRKGEDASMVNDPNVYCRFQASIGNDISSNWGVRLVYADDI